MHGSLGFLGEVTSVNDERGYGMIAARTVRREDGGKLGLVIPSDIFIHRKSTRGPNNQPLDLKVGMTLVFLIGPNERREGQLRALKAELAEQPHRSDLGK